MADEDGDTIFGKIIRGDIKGPPFLHEDDKVVLFIVVLFAFCIYLCSL
jgi:hypothetical protein